MQNDLVLLTDGPLIDQQDLVEKIGWELKPEGLCRDDSCVLVPDPAALHAEGKVVAIAVADLLDRPSLFDADSGVVAIGAPRASRTAALNDLRAPDFVLPDLDGTPHALSDHRSKKRLLVAFSSW